MPKKLALEIELVPGTAWARNARRALSKESWEYLRSKFGATGYVFTDLGEGRLVVSGWSGRICQICKGEQNERDLELHEVWEYDDRNRIQRLANLIPVCTDCHNSLHVGRASAVGLLEPALRHLAKVNQWSLKQARSYVEKALDTWHERSRHDYTLDLSFLEKWIPASRIHMHWIEQRPVWVGDKVDAILWARDVIKSNALVLDTETTGLLDKGNVEAIEIALINMKGRMLYYKRLKPKYRIPAGVIKIHGITNKAVANCPTFVEEYEKLRGVVDGRLLISYNSRFDSEILRRTCRLYGISPFECAWQCAMHAYSAYVESGRWVRLPKGRHNALGDARAVLRLINKMARTRNL